MDGYSHVNFERKFLTFILKNIKSLRTTESSCCGPALPDRNLRRAEGKQLIHQGETPLLCGWACLPKAVASDFPLISAEEVKTGITNERV